MEQNYSPSHRNVNAFWKLLSMPTPPPRAPLYFPVISPSPAEKDESL